MVPPVQFSDPVTVLPLLLPNVPLDMVNVGILVVCPELRFNVPTLTETVPSELTELPAPKVNVPPVTVTEVFALTVAPEPIVTVLEVLATLILPPMTAAVPNVTEPPLAFREPVMS
jgi:hypothetical protein